MSKERKDEKETSFYSTQLANERHHLPITPEAVGIGEMALTSKYAGGRRWRRTTSEGEGVGPLELAIAKEKSFKDG